MKFINNKIIPSYIEDEIVLKKENRNVLENDDLKVIKCSNCGASIDVLKGECEYCHTKINSIQEWVIDD